MRSSSNMTIDQTRRKKIFFTGQKLKTIVKTEKGVDLAIPNCLYTLTSITRSRRKLLCLAITELFMFIDTLYTADDHDTRRKVTLGKCLSLSMSMLLYPHESRSACCYLSVSIVIVCRLSQSSG